MNKTSELDTWAIVELFGHVKMAGRVSEQLVAGATMLRLDVPGTEDSPAFTRFYGAGAVYSITPTDEAVARRAVDVLRAKPITVYGVVAPERQLEAGARAGYEDDWRATSPRYDDEDDDYGPDESELQEMAAERARREALALVAGRCVFLDVETTGLQDVDQVVEVAVLDTDGTVLLDTLVKPTVLISEGAYLVHGLTSLDVAEAPTFAQVWPQLVEAVQGRQVVVYNAAFDLRMLRQSARAVGIEDFGEQIHAKDMHCAMEMYAQFWGDWDHYHENYRYQQLHHAARQQGIWIPDDLHRARGDAELTRQVFLKIAGEKDLFGE